MVGKALQHVVHLLDRMHHQPRKKRIVAGDLVAFDEVRNVSDQPLDQIQLARQR
jgi:hypothetical protein